MAWDWGRNVSKWGNVVLQIAHDNPDVVVADDANVAFTDDAPITAINRQASEHDEQAVLFSWAAMAQGEHPELAMLFAVPNGGQRHPAVAAQLKAEGVRAGVPDVFLAVPRGRFHGLAIEMKVKPNKPTAQQLEWIALLRHYGYSAVVCFGAQDAINTVKAYLSQDVTP